MPTERGLFVHWSTNDIYIRSNYGVNVASALSALFIYSCELAVNMSVKELIELWGRIFYYHRSD